MQFRDKRDIKDTNDILVSLVSFISAVLVLRLSIPLKMQPKFTSWSLLLFIALTVAGCKKEKHEDQNQYPDCFENLTSTPFTGMEACGNTITFKLNASQAVVFSYDDNQIDFRSGCKKFNLADYPSVLDISYYTYEYSPDSIYFGYCDGVAYPPELHAVKTKWNAVSGTIIAAVSKEKSLRDPCEPYRLSIYLESIKFIKENSTTDTILNSLVMKDAFMLQCLL
jgi:hypothetical protein